MGKSLVIVESPAKIKTLKKFLGSQYLLESSVGHIRDLPVKEFGIDIEHDFQPTYVTMPDKAEVIKKLKNAAKSCDTIFLCPDPDREGEAIAWHIQEILKPIAKGKKIVRATFNSITKNAVLDALSHPTEINESLVEAQQARRIFDRIVGYTLSPIVSRRIQRGRKEALSAGRVQSVALKLVVDREKEIEAHIPIEYWKLTAQFSTKQKDPYNPFSTYLYSVEGKKIAKEVEEGKKLATISNQTEAERVLKLVKSAPFSVVSVEKKQKKRYPVPPFITSTLQQEASRHFGFSSARTMQVAQKLYEGVDLGEQGTEGLITYMRTDSVRIAPEAISDVRTLILSEYGKEYVTEAPKQYSSKKSAQDAHEAIRPTNVFNTPEKVRPYLTKEQFLLYELIWKRFIASQMNPAIYDTVTADLENSCKVCMRATGSIIKFSGFLKVYEEKSDEDIEDDKKRLLPELVVNDPVDLVDTFLEQAFTRPPARYSEASLVKELEKSGIGRPSTYASIMNKIQSRDYTVKESGRLKPTELGRVLVAFLEANFTQIMDISFTARMEDDLELVAEDKKDWKAILKEFWKAFAPLLDQAEKEAFVPKIATTTPCPKCHEGHLQKIWFKGKYFFGCDRYPDCDFSAALEELEFDRSEYIEDFDWEQKCPLCSGEMKVRHGKFGAFLGCTNYPQCKGIVNIPKKGEKYIPESELPACPAIGCDGHLVMRKSRFGKTFFSCSNYPDCDVIVNNLDEIDTKYANHPKTPYVKKKGSKTKKGQKTTSAKKTAKKTSKKESEKPKVKLNQALQDVLGEKELTRPEITKKLWDYIKKNNLQNPSDKREIVPDEKLAKVFGSQAPVNMFKLQEKISSSLEK
jgi:DNA topoisomerase-1